MKKTRKILASLGIVAAVAGVGVMAAACGPDSVDEFANAEVINYNQFSTFQADADNTFVGGYEVTYKLTQKNTAETAFWQESEMAVRGIVLKVQDGQTYADAHFTLQSKSNANIYGSKMKLDLYADVTVLNTTVDDEAVVMVYFTVDNKNYQIELQKLMQLAGTSQGLMSSLAQIISGYMILTTAKTPINSNWLTEEVQDGEYKELTDGDVTKFQISKTTSVAESAVDEESLSLKYEDAKLVEFSERSKQSSDNGEVVTESAENVKLATVTVTAPNNLDDYEEVNEEYFAVM